MKYKSKRPLTKSFSTSAENAEWIEKMAKDNFTSQSEVINKIIEKERMMEREKC